MNKGQSASGGADDEELKAKSKKFYALCSMAYEKYLILALCSLLFILSSISLPSSVQSTICVGECVCSNCHTMHNSQNAESMRLDKAQIIGSGAGECLDCHAETRAVLLQLDCVGCHAKDVNGGSNIVGGWPQIALSTIATTPLAGGNYKYVFSDDTFGHNVHGFGAVSSDSNLGNNPPGYESGYDPSSGKYQTGNLAGRVMCAGQNGCHGNRDQVSPILAMRGTHHASDSMLKFGSIDENQQGGGTGGTTDYTTAGKSYRFLYNVHGGEDSNWEGVSPGTTVHNEYKGATFSAKATQAWANVDTISEFCAECHGDFHGGSIGSASPWFRHPTDLSLPATNEYAAYTTYNLTAPVARTIIPTNSPSGVVTPSGTTNDIIMCLSCHRAHASPYYKIMRWDYKSSTLSTALSGCNVCHTSKN